MITGRPERLPGFSYVGVQRYSLTFCAYRRARRFESADCVTRTLSNILRAAERESFAIPAYCFMPDHLHLLVEGLSDSSDLKAFIKLAKQYSGYHHRQAANERLWQPYVYEHVVRDDERCEDIIRYIVENPVRAKLVESPGDYPFLGSCTVTRAALLQSVWRESWRPG